MDDKTCDVTIGTGAHTYCIETVTKIDLLSMLQNIYIVLIFENVLKSIIYLGVASGASIL